MNENLKKENFYLAVNKKWLEETEIPGDKASFSTFARLSDDLEKLLIEKSNNWKDGKEEIPNFPLLDEYVKLYKMASDYEIREELGIIPALPYLEEINNIKSFSDLNTKYVEFARKGYFLPFNFAVGQDFKDSSKQKLNFFTPRLILPSKEYYANQQKKEQLLGLFKQSTYVILKEFKLSDEKIKELIDGTVAFDELLVKYKPSSVERARYTEMYHLLKIDEVAKATNIFDIKKIANELVGQNVKELIVSYMPYVTFLKEVIIPENFNILKSWMYTMQILYFSGYLTNNLRILNGHFKRVLTGRKEPSSPEKDAFYLVNEVFSDHLGKYYGVTYFGEKAKNDVSRMVVEMIEVYKKRLKNITWLTESTRKRAIKKLSNLGYHVGYPDEFHKFYDDVKILDYQSGNNVLSNIMNFNLLRNNANFNEYLKPINKNLWNMPAHMVNAYYSPFMNHIVFPAAILQDPFYDINNSSASNYGGIGAVMAHEISHAFDNNGSLIDEKGNLNSWWTEEDVINFNKIRDDVIKQFDGLMILSGGKCNGTLTVSENIADSGGFNCALEAAQKRKDFSPKDFFTTWAKIWRRKSRPEFEQMLLTVDVHAPTELRCNMQLSNCDLFYDTYDINEKDKMYLEKEKRIKIW